MSSAQSTAPEALVEQVRKLATELRDWPSQRRVMRTCGVGAPKADAALAALRSVGFNPAPVPAPPPALSLVPNTPAGTPEAHAPDALPDAPETQPERAPDAPETHAPSAPETHQEPRTERTQEHVRDAPVNAPEALTERPYLDVEPQVTPDAGAPTPVPAKRVPRWPILVIALGAFVSIWSGWVGLGKLTGFGPVVLLPGIADEWVINSAITLPLGVEAYAAYAMWVWLSDAPTSALARAFARYSALGALALGAAGQVAYHLMVAAGMTAAPWQITAFVSCLPVVVLGCAGALVHLTHTQEVQ